MVQAVLFFAGFISVLLGIFVLLNNPRSRIFRWYLLFSLTSATWILVNALSINNGTPLKLHGSRLLIAGQFITPSSLAALLAYFYFLHSFVTGKVEKKTYLLALPSLVIASLSFTNFNVFLQGDGLELGGLYPYYLSVLAFNLLLVLTAVLRHYSSRAVASNTRGQLKYLRIGSIGTLVPALFFGAIIPIFSSSQLSNLAPLFTLVFLTAAALAMVRHSLFDVKLVVARALAYSASLVLLTSLYGFIVFGLATLLFDLHIPLYAQVLLSAATGLACLIFPRLRQKFDTVTSRLFYQDAYDPQELYAQLNKALISSLDIGYLMKQSISIIETALKSGYTVVGLSDAQSRQRFFASKKITTSPEDMAKLRRLLPNIRRKVTLADSLDNPDQEELKLIMQKNDLAVIIRLAQNVRNGEEGFGYIGLGVKKSGNPYTQQDIRVLDTVANELIIAIQNALHYEEIQQFNLVLQAKVDEATRKLRSTNEKLKTLDETKDDFISMASHQLRTPLTSIKGYLSMVLEGDAGKVNETQAKMLGQAFVSSQRMVYLIADLLNVSRLKTGKFVIEAAPTNLAKMVSEEIDQLVETAGGKQIELTYKQPKDFPSVMLDETKTRQVIMNFMDNAIYYTPSGGHIRVELVDAPTSVELRVVDDGIGVPKAEQHHLFTKFYRAGNARKARPDGTGLGLFMAKKVVLAQGGSIIFESKEGKGSTFGFLFPKHSSHTVAKFPVVPEKSTAK